MNKKDGEQRGWWPKRVMNNRKSSKSSRIFFLNICGNEEGEHKCDEVVKRQNVKRRSSTLKRSSIKETNFEAVKTKSIAR